MLPEVMIKVAVEGKPFSREGKLATNQ